MLKKIFFLFLFATGSATIYAQTTSMGKVTKTREQEKQERKDRINKMAKEYEEGSLVYAKQTAFGVKLNTDGWSLAYEHGKYKTINNTNLWSVELGERKNPKEEKVTPTQESGGFLFIGNPYVYGKRNNFYYLKGGLGSQKLVGGKGNKNGVAVSAIYGGGISLGYLKPYYISVADPEQPGQAIDIKYSDSTEAQFLDTDPKNVYGAAGFTKGLTEGKIVPGAYAKLAMRFDYGRYNELLSAVEVGINAEYYSKSMPILINNPERKFFFNGYIAFQFGKRK